MIIDNDFFGLWDSVRLNKSFADGVLPPILAETCYGRPGGKVNVALQAIEIPSPLGVRNHEIPPQIILSGLPVSCQEES